MADVTGLHSSICPSQAHTQSLKRLNSDHTPLLVEGWSELTRIELSLKTGSPPSYSCQVEGIAVGLSVTRFSP